MEPGRAAAVPTTGAPRPSSRDRPSFAVRLTRCYNLATPMPRLPIRLFRTTLATFALIGVGVASGPDVWAVDELRFKNGDRLTGELVEEANGRIRFRNPALGEITVASSEATVVTVPDMPVESLAGLPPAAADHGASPAPTPPSRPAVTAATTPAPTTQGTGTAATATAAKPANPGANASRASAAPDPARWRGKLEFGFKQQSGGTEAVDFSLRMEADRKIGRNQLRATGRSLYGERSDRITSDRYDATFRWRRDFSTRLFSQTLTTYLRDRVKSIDASYDQNVGFGYRVLNRDRHVVNAGVGATGQYRDSGNADPNLILLGEVFEDYTYRINGRFTLTQNALVQWSDEETSDTLGGRQNYKFQFDTALQGKFTDRLSLNLRFEHEFDNAVANRDARTDQRITSSIGYAF